MQSNIVIPQWLLTFVANIFPAFLVGVFTAVVSVRLALRRFHAERWWERKADAYSRIVEALHSTMEYCLAHAAADEAGKFVIEGREKQLDEDYDRAFRELRKATHVGAYIISDEAADVLATLEKRPRLDLKDYALFEIYQADYEANKKALVEIKRIAKRDLRVSDL
jgi:hypothetical protein